MAAVNNKRLAKIWNPGNVRLQTRNCKLKNLMLKVSNITASPLRFSRLKINRRLRDDWARISLRSPISKSYGWKIFGYISLHVRWVIYRPVKITIRNGYVKSYMYFLPLHVVLSKGVSYARLPAMPPAGSNPGIDAMCRLSLLLVLSLVPRGFSPGTSVFPSPLKPTFSNSNSIWNARTRFNEFLRTPKCSVEVGDFYYPKGQPSCIIHWKEI